MGRWAGDAAFTCSSTGCGSVSRNMLQGTRQVWQSGPALLVPLAGAAIAARVLDSRAFQEAPHAVIYVHCAKLREVDTTRVLQHAMEARKRCARAERAAWCGLLGDSW